MGFDEASMKNMAKMIKLMLPYEYDYIPKTTASKTLNDIFQSVKEDSPQLGEMEPFLGSIMQKIDKSRDTSKLDRTFMKVWAIIHKRYPPTNKVHPYPLEFEDEHEMS